MLEIRHRGLDPGKAVLHGGSRGALAGKVAQERGGSLADTPCFARRFGLAVACYEAAIRVDQAELGETTDYPQGGLNSPAESLEKRDSRTSALHNPVHSSPIDPDLQRLLDAWPTLPAALRAGIVAMVDAARMKG